VSVKVSQQVLAKELGRRKLRKELALDPAFPLQNAFILDRSRFVAAQCSRRAGKTSGLAYRFARTLEANPGAQCVYMALTRESAKDILWPVLIEMNDTHNLGWTFTESKLEARTPNGSSLKLYGADQKNFIKRLKGRKYPGVAIDEAQDFGVHLRSLVDDVLTPAISDYADGWLALTGTPGPVPSGYFFDVTHGGRFGYSVHHWTLLDNPFMPNPATFIAELKLRQEWDDANPTYLREYCNKWVLDTQSLWIRYLESQNHYEILPTLKWNYILGVDFGFKDADALAVLAWHESDPNTYLVEEVVTRGQDITGVAEQIQVLMKKYDIAVITADEGALGKKMAEEMRRRFHIPMQPAEKTRKQETVSFLNDTLRTGKFKAKKDSMFAQDSYLVQIDWDKSTPDKIIVKKQPHSDIIDAVLYAFKVSPAFTYQKPKDKPKQGTPEWETAETQAMEDAAMEYFLAMEQAAFTDPYGDY
jgi:hypothetical protein